MRNLGPGDVIGGYRIEDFAGRGGMGLVYRAWQERPQRLVAIKVIAPALAADPSFRARFEREATSAAQIEHPNVIPIYEVGEQDGLLFIAMRYVDGVDLGEKIAHEGPLEAIHAARLVAQVAAALDAAHSHGVVHRDVKPGNILVTAAEHLYLTDFGLTKRVADSGGLSVTGMIVGTPDYIAPEQVEGRSRVDARADVYALGCVTHQMLSGKVPFERNSDMATLFAHVNDPVPRLDNVPAPLADAVQRALQKRPEDRFLSAGDFARAVTAGAAGHQMVEPERAVAVGPAAAARAHEATVVAGPSALDAAVTPATPAVAGAPAAGAAGLPETEVGQAPPTERAGEGRRDRGRLPPGGGRGSRPPRPMFVGGGVLVGVAAAALIAVAVLSGGNGGGRKHVVTPASAKSAPATHAGVTRRVGSTGPSPGALAGATGASANRVTLPPAPSPPVIDECRHQLTFGADGTAGPPKCANGDLNVAAWQYYSQGYGRLLSLGTFATPSQVINALCTNPHATNPQTQIAYQLAQAYYGWQFAVDPGAGYPADCG